MQGSTTGGVVVDLAETNIWIHLPSSGTDATHDSPLRFSGGIAVDGRGRLRYGADEARGDEQLLRGCCDVSVIRSRCWWAAG